MMETVPTAVIAKAFDVSTRRVTQLAAEGVVVRAGRGQFDLIASTANYCRRLREVASGRSENAPDLTAERTRLAREQADRIALQNEVQRGTLIDASEAGARWADEIVKLRARLLAVPGDVALSLPHLTKHDLSEIDRALRDAMTAIADRTA
jgi:phage terminase Nu1 subunit (DNA packaging protein)